MDKISSTTSESDNNSLSKNEKEADKDNHNSNIIKSNNYKSDDNLKTTYPLLFK